VGAGTQPQGPTGEQKIDHLHDKVFANSLLTLGAGKGAALDSFSGWLLAGFGAGLALLLSNLDSVAPYLPISTVRLAAFIFIIAAAFGVAEKYLSTLVSGAVEAFLVSSELGEKMAERDIDLDFDFIFAETERASFPPARWIVARMLRKVREGDLVASGRFFSRCSQVQSIFVLCEAVLIILATSYCKWAHKHHRITPRCTG
jgi:hypothetical protein